MRLKYICGSCSYSTIQDFRGQIIGQPCLISEKAPRRIDYQCPECGLSHWRINRSFTITERIYYFIYQKLLNLLSKLGIRNKVFSKKNTVQDWIASDP